MEDSCVQGRKLRILTVVDEFTRESYETYVDYSIPAAKVIEVLEFLFFLHGFPEYLRSDNGPEFVAAAIQTGGSDGHVAALRDHDDRQSQTAELVFEPDGRRGGPGDAAEEDLAGLVQGAGGPLDGVLLEQAPRVENIPPGLFEGLKERTGRFLGPTVPVFREFLRQEDLEFLEARAAEFATQTHDGAVADPTVLDHVGDRHGECVSVSSQEVKVGVGALRLSAFDSSVHGLVQIPTSPFSAGQRTMSITCWYHYKDIAGNGSTARPFVFETAPNYVVSYGARFETGGLDLGEWYLLGTPGFSDTTGPVDPNPAGWHHVALVYDAIAGTGSFYFDGELRDQLTGKPYEKLGDGLGAHDMLNIGDYRAADGGRMWDGYIDDLAAFDVELNAGTVRGDP